MFAREARHALTDEGIDPVQTGGTILTRARGALIDVWGQKQKTHEAFSKVFFYRFF